MTTFISDSLKLNASDLAQLEKVGFSPVYIGKEYEILQNPEIFEAVICTNLFSYNDISKFDNLRFIQLLSAGYDRVPLGEITKRGIAISNIGGVYSKPMSEFTVMRILEMYKNSQYFAENQKTKSWQKDRNILSLDKKTALIIGLGNYGNECARLLSCFGVRVIGVNRKFKKTDFVDEYVPFEDFRQHLPEADIVIIAAALTDDTAGFFDKNCFAMMKNGAVFINFARGGLIDNEALASALDEKLLGAALDVFDNEPLEESSPLWDKENLLISPHNSFISDTNHNDIIKTILSNAVKHHDTANN